MCGDSGGGGEESAEAKRLYRIQGDISEDMFRTWKETYLPVERETIADVRRLSDPDYVDSRVGRAQEDVSKEFARAGGIEDRRLSGLGLNAADPMYAARKRQVGLSEATARAGVGNAARSDLENKALQGKMAISQTGRGLANMGLSGIGSSAGGYAGLANSQRAAGAQSSAGFGNAIGTGLGLWGANGFAGLGGAGGAGAAGGFTGTATAAGAGIGGYSAAAAGTAATAAEAAAAEAMLLEAGILAV